MPATSLNTSATGGFLAPLTPAPDDDLVLDQFLQRLVVGCTGLRPESVRARYVTLDDGEKATSRNPNQRENWASVGVMSMEAEGQPALVHDGAGEGTSTQIQHMRLDVLASFYGPRSSALAELLRAALYVPQNRDTLFREGMGLIDVGDGRRIPEITNTSPRRRTDIGFRLRRRVERTYAIRNVLELTGTLTGQGGSQDGVVHQQNNLKTPRG